MNAYRLADILYNSNLFQVYKKADKQYEQF